MKGQLKLSVIESFEILKLFLNYSFIFEDVILLIIQTLYVQSQLIKSTMKNNKKGSKVLHLFVWQT